VKILVLYDSQTGNVEQMAKLVAAGAQEIDGVEVRLRKIAQRRPLLGDRT
jgi:multimeric flavodoxin WrbA